MRKFKHSYDGVDVEFEYKGNINEQTAIERIKLICGIRDYTFLGFVGDIWKDQNTYLRLKCNKCGYEWDKTTYKYLLKGNGCKRCANLNNCIKISEKLALSNIQDKCKQHNYTFIGFVGGKYINAYTYLIIKCNSCGYEWKTCNYHNFIHSNTNCPQCSTSKIEEDVKCLLNDKNIGYIYNAKIQELDRLQLDFYIPSKKIAIECQGQQHFYPVEYYGGTEGLQKQIERDERKLKLCKANGIKLLYYSNLGIDYPYQVFEDKEKLLQEILKNNTNEN